MSIHSKTQSGGEHMFDSEDGKMDYSKAVTFTDSETEYQSKTKAVEVSGRTENFLEEKCTSRVQNYDRKCRTNTHFPTCQPLTPQLDNNASFGERVRVVNILCVYLKSHMTVRAFQYFTCI